MQNAFIARAVTVPLYPFTGRFRSVISKKTAVSVFHDFGFSIHKMSIALHITSVENDQTYHFASNHTPDGQHCCLFVNWQFM